MEVKKRTEEKLKLMKLDQIAGLLK
ncbi:hypothetical protein MUP65_02675 [Patescibacteria group bacterium]|nr:hypothetical protein [Patescibacteria group bacterium]